MKKNLYWTNRDEALRNITEEELLKVLKSLYGDALNDIIRVLKENQINDASQYREFVSLIHGDSDRATGLHYISSSTLDYNRAMKIRNSILQRIRELGVAEEAAMHDGYYLLNSTLSDSYVYDKNVVGSVEYYNKLMEDYPEGKYVHKSTQEKYKQNVAEQMADKERGLVDLEQTYAAVNDNKSFLKRSRFDDGISDSKYPDYSKQYRKYIRQVLNHTAEPLEQDHAIEQLINKVWASDGKNWSDRVWSNKSKLAEQLTKDLSKVLSEGYSGEDVVKAMVQDIYDYDGPTAFEDSNNVYQAIAGSMGASYRNASRLVRTELTYIQNQAAAERYQDMGFSRYEIIAEKNERTCKLCKKMNGKRFAYAEMEVGKNCPPFHPNCRCTIAPIIEDSDYNNQTDKKAANYAQELSTGLEPRYEQRNKLTGTIINRFKTIKQAEEANQFKSDALRNMLNRGTVPKDFNDYLNESTPYAYEWTKDSERLDLIQTQDYRKRWNQYLKEMQEAEDLYKKRLARQRAKEWREQKKKQGGK